MSAAEEMEKLHADIDTTAFLANRVGDHRYSAQLREWADRIAAIREGLGKAQGKAVAWCVESADGTLWGASVKRDKPAMSAFSLEQTLVPLYRADPPADSAPSLDGIKVSLCAPTASEPFRQLACEVVDIGHSDRALVVECKELEMEKADSAQVLVEALEKDAARYRKLRSSNWYIGPMPSCAAYSAGNHFDDRNTSRQELDAAVDALAAHKSEGKPSHEERHHPTCNFTRYVDGVCDCGVHKSEGKG